MAEKFNEDTELDYVELGEFVPELEDLYGKVESGEKGPEEVRDLTEKEFNVLRQKNILTKEEMKAVVKYANENNYDELYLGLTSLDVDTATALVEFEGVILYLDGLTNLDVETAGVLAKPREYLSLKGLTSLDVDTATALAQFEGILYLDGLILDADIAAALAQFKGEMISLGGLDNVSDEVVKNLIPLIYKIRNYAGQKNRIEEVRIRVERGKKMDEYIGTLQQKIEETRKKIDREGERGNLEYDWLTGTIKSRGNAVKVKRLTWYVKDRISLEGLDLRSGLGLDTGVWLANFKNWFKHTYPGQKVELKTDLINKKFMNFEKTFVVEGKTLIARRDMPVFSDEDMEKITEWLNN